MGRGWTRTDADTALKTSDFDYDLPVELIAQTPIEPRDAARLLVVDRGSGRLAHRSFCDIVDYLRPGDLLVGNNSRVIPARLRGVKETGGAVEIFVAAGRLPHPSPPPLRRGRGQGGGGGGLGMPGWG